MPPSRSLRYKERLLQRIAETGITMPACSYCRRQHLVCVVSSDSDRCFGCVKAGGNTKCDVFGPSPGEWDALERTEKRLADDLKASRVAQDELMGRLFAMQRELLAMQARTTRLEKQREFFRQKAGEMLRRGLRSLDDLEAAEASEAARAAEEDGHPSPTPPSGDSSDPSLLDPDFASALVDFDPADPFWTQLGFDSGQMPPGFDDVGGTGRLAVDS